MEDRVNREDICVNFILICIALTGIIPQLFISVSVVFVTFFLGMKKRMFLLFPVMIFYYSQLGLIFGVSVYRIYTLMFIFMIIFFEKKKIYFSKRLMLPFVVFIIYEILVMSRLSFKMSFFSSLDILCIVFLMNFYLKDKKNIKEFFLIYTKVAIIAFLTGIIINNSNSTTWNYSGTLVEISRFQSTFNDPNYMGFFYTVAVFAVVILSLFNKKIQKILILILLVMILSSLSFTAIIGNIFLWGIYLVVTKKINIRTVIYAIGIIVLAVIAYNYGLVYRETPILGDLSYRIESKLNAIALHDYADVTTNRNELSKLHLEYFMNQGIFKQFFGGNLANTYAVELGYIKGAAHNEYIDSLLNVGIIGSSILFGSILMRLVKLLNRYNNSKIKEYLFIAMCKLILLYYSLALTIFLDFRFMFAIFI